MLVRDAMDKKAPFISDTASFAQASAIFVTSRCISIAVVDDHHNLLGVITESDLLQVLIPNINEIEAGNGTMHDAVKLFIENSKFLANQSIKRLLISNPITVHPDDNLLKVATIMLAKHLKRMPVVENGKYIGSISRADICWLLTLQS